MRQLGLGLVAVRRPLARPRAPPTGQHTLRQQAPFRHARTQTWRILEPRVHHQPPRSPFRRYIDKLLGRVLPNYVPRGPPNTRFKYKAMGGKAFAKYTRRTRRHRARKRRRSRALEAHNREEALSLTYQATPLVLGLDAINCPGVRPYTEKDEIEQTERWRAVPEMDALFRRMVRARDEIEASKTKWHAGLQQHDSKRVTERDVLAVALLGVPPDTSPASDAQASSAQAPRLGYVTRRVLAQIGVTARIAEDVHHTVRMLLHRLKQQQPQQEQPAARSRDEFRSALAREHDLGRIQRLVAPLLQTQWGRALVFECRGDIVAACTRDRRLSGKGRAWTVYRFLEHLAAGLAADGFEFELATGPAARQLSNRLFDQTRIVVQNESAFEGTCAEGRRSESVTTADK